MTLANESGIDTRTLYPLLMRQCIAVLRRSRHKSVLVRVRQRRVTKLRITVKPTRGQMTVFIPEHWRERYGDWEHFAPAIAQQAHIGFLNIAGKRRLPDYCLNPPEDYSKFREAALITFISCARSQQQIYEQRLVLLEARLGRARACVRLFRGQARRLKAQRDVTKHRLKKLRVKHAVSKSETAR